MCWLQLWVCWYCFFELVVDGFLWLWHCCCVTFNGPGSGSLSVLGGGLIGMWNTLGGVMGVSSALRVPSSCECSTMLNS